MHIVLPCFHWSYGLGECSSLRAHLIDIFFLAKTNVLFREAISKWIFWYIGLTSIKEGTLLVYCLMAILLAWGLNTNLGNIWFSLALSVEVWRRWIDAPALCTFLSFLLSEFSEVVNGLCMQVSAILICVVMGLFSVMNWQLSSLPWFLDAPVFTCESPVGDVGERYLWNG